MTLYTTFALLTEAGACQDRYRHLAEALGGVETYGEHTPITILQVLDANGLYDALWALRAVADEQVERRDRISLLLARDYGAASPGRPACEARLREVLTDETN